MDMILKNTFQRISPAYELIADVTVGTNTTQVDFNGLNIGKDDELLLVSDWYCSTLASEMYLYFNNNNTTTNYYSQDSGASNTSINSSRSNKAYITYNAGSTNNKTFFISRIKLTNSGYGVHQTNANYYYNTGSALALGMVCGTSTFSMTSITSLRFSTQTTNAIGTGSRFQLYKLVAEKVADIIVPSNTTSVDITGLNIGKDGEYYLVSEMNNAPSCYLYANGNTTNSNYYVQRLDVYGATITGSRTNNPIYIDGNVRYASTNIKLANSGYFIYQTNQIKSTSGSDIRLWKGYGTSTFTTPSVSQLTITAGAANGILANSRFTLYKMK